MSRPRRPTAEELALWRRAMGVSAPQPERTPPVAPVEPPALRLERRPAVSQTRRTSAALDPHRPVGLDRRSWLRLKRGQVSIEQTLDLHGRTQEEAHRALGGFLAAAQAAGCRCVLVVTGKGVESGGTLRHMVPRWLNESANPGAYRGVLSGAGAPRRRRRAVHSATPSARALTHATTAAAAFCGGPERLAGAAPGADRRRTATVPWLPPGCGPRGGCRRHEVWLKSPCYAHPWPFRRRSASRATMVE